MTTKIPAELSSTPSITDAGTASIDISGSADPIFKMQGSGHPQLRLKTTGTTDNTSIDFGDSDSEVRGRVLYNHANDYLQLQTSSANRVRIDSDGLKFGSDSAAANALDDYEEGTWTVSDGSGAGLSFTVDKNRYTKIGRFVMAHTRVTYPTTTDGSTATLALPFTPSTDCTGSVTGGICTEQGVASGIAVTASIDGTAGTRFRSNGVGAFTNADLSGVTLRFTVTFITA
tara:strand:- start:328 stop:1017 length:690 start_codon:yes stop_codon:yes gene_type:complete